MVGSIEPCGAWRIVTHQLDEGEMLARVDHGAWATSREAAKSPRWLDSVAHPSSATSRAIETELRTCYGGLVAVKKSEMVRRSEEGKLDRIVI